jgi:hypothetical protein
MTDVYSPDLILHRGLFATLDRSNRQDGRFTQVGREQDINRHRRTRLSAVQSVRLAAAAQDRRD